MYCFVSNHLARPQTESSLGLLNMSLTGSLHPQTLQRPPAMCLAPNLAWGCRLFPPPCFPRATRKGAERSVQPCGEHPGPAIPLCFTCFITRHLLSPSLSYSSVQLLFSCAGQAIADTNKPLSTHIVNWTSRFVSSALFGGGKVHSAKCTDFNNTIW